ncbi:unnamed protein product [Cladocopium goreaui]|uniref:Aminodeoxychorismate synthase component 1 (ADC synthase) (ADCS) (4-amino-4-deoxychorismate synthas e component 1) n=1 Tax=Cladocopium goreaui TaxID=2562237 RepID=A0A9P1BM77_9DINO|nr:unnamed protein product [Cladocopium goreaui]
MYDKKKWPGMCQATKMGCLRGPKTSQNIVFSGFVGESIPPNCSLEETIVAAALADDGKRGWCWDVGADDQLMPFVAEGLRKRALWGASGSSQNAPDQLMLHSGGPVTDVASSTLLAGPPMLRFLAKQPQVGRTVPARNSPLQGQLPLLRSEETVPLNWQPQQWRFGRWQALSELPPQRRLGPALRQVAACARQTSSDALWLSEAAKDGALPVRGSALAGLLAYDLVQWTQPLALEHPPEPSECLGSKLIGKAFAKLYLGCWQLFTVWTDGLCTRGEADMGGAVVQSLTNESSMLALRPQLLVHRDLEPLDMDDFCSRFCGADAIRDGQFYQLNFGRSWQGEMRESPWQLMQKLFKHNAAPYSGFLQLQVDGLSSALCSCSPELLLSVQHGSLSTCPIKGTCARSKDAREDLQLRQEMVASQKEVAEHMMLVDLQRHDLGVASCPSSVAWDRWRVEAFPNIQHMVSKVTGRLCPSSDVWAALEAVFPGGSITGCPKTATIAAIDALEKEPRRCWTGSLGFADLFTGDGQWNILIRTLEAEAQDSSWRAVVKAGGGLTIGSDPSAEVQEAKLKV